MCVCLSLTHHTQWKWAVNMSSTQQRQQQWQKKGENKRWTNKCRRKRWRRRQKDLHRQKKWLRRKMNRMKNKSNVCLYVCVRVCGKNDEKKKSFTQFKARQERVSENLSCKYSVTARWMLNTQYEYCVPKTTTVTLQIFFIFFARSLFPRFFCFIDTYINLLYFYTRILCCGWFLWHRFHVNYYFFWFMLLRQHWDETSLHTYTDDIVLIVHRDAHSAHTIITHSLTHTKRRKSFLRMVWRFCLNSIFPNFFASNENNFIGIAMPSLHVVLKIWLFSTRSNFVVAEVVCSKKIRETEW